MTGDIVVRPVRVADREFIHGLRNQQISSSTALWEDLPETATRTRAWIRAHVATGGVLVAQAPSGELLGFGAFAPYREASGYRHTVEDSIYVSATARGRGVGRALLDEVIRAASHGGAHVIVAAIESGNTASITLHRTAGFRTSGVLRQVGWKFGRWLDLTLMQWSSEAPDAADGDGGSAAPGPVRLDTPR